jgi:hypothetical protein
MAPRFTSKTINLLLSISALCMFAAVNEASAGNVEDGVDGIVCMTVMPECDQDGNLVGDLARPESPCYHYYENICLRQKLDELLNENQFCSEELRVSKQQARKSKTKNRCNRK